MRPQLRHLQSRLYLTHDEIAEVLSRKELCSFRLRIWRGKACPAIVLVSQTAAGPSPSWSSSQAANTIYRAHLGFPAEGMLYFEDETVFGVRRLYLVEFAVFGHGSRRALFHPVRHEVDWADLEAMTGQGIPRRSRAGPTAVSSRARMQTDIKRPSHSSAGASSCPARGRRSLWGARALLLGGMIIYSAFAFIAAKWQQPIIAAIFVFLTAEGFARLLLR
jgi:hypothetical protein